MKTTARKLRTARVMGTVNPKTARKSIVLYSPDADFCVSLQLLLQNRYDITTTSDVDMIVMLAKAFKADMLIVDGSPSRSMVGRFGAIKRDRPPTVIMMFSHGHPQPDHAFDPLGGTIDAMFAKPIDIDEMVDRIHELIGDLA
jgi:DNA-binding response OmpR family regulator